MTDTYRCAVCEDVTVEDCDIVCDDCWEKVKPENNAKVFEVWQKATE